MVPDFLHGAPPTDAYAAFIKKSCMKFVNARKLDRKSGCTFGANMGHPSREGGFVLWSNFGAAVMLRRAPSTD
jgi:hypothetical protein